MNTDELDIGQVATELEYSVQYVRYLIRNKKLASTLKPIFEGATTLKHTITREELERYKNETHMRSKRKDRRNKFVFYATPKEYEEVVATLRGAGLTEVADTVVPANTVKALHYLKAAEADGGGRFVE